MSSEVVSASRIVAAPADVVFALVADPAQQPGWDGNDNLGSAETGQRVRGVGDVFTMTLLRGAVRENHVVEFDEGRLIAWRPAEPGATPPGHLWRWELEPLTDGRTRVTHTYDWTALDDPARLERARATTSAALQASLDRLAAAAETRAGLPALFAGLSVRDLPAAVAWYERLFGTPPSMLPDDDEAVWEVAPGRSVYVERRPAHAGHGLVTLFVDDLSDLVAGASSRGLEPDLDETYDNGVRKVTYRDPDGNEVGFGGFGG
ncbi:hypothetical protein G5V58_11220 [Nocardioides anomalus]|uniref:VOC domain-containing protein n=1 Tax=Nocardioides anomalus TaxID=2712223 RepID=A0A6G6WDY2_9ACTN|nr:SRPBCC family protein [Nocardioides anomalus]QIG43250.1 hypothetical protein G5V58_11220 [Nocardioides anomalus]